MLTHHIIGSWHLEVTQVQAKLRRYAGQDADAAFAADPPKPYGAICSADIRGMSAELSGMLVKPPALTRADRRVIEQMLRRVGAETSSADRGGVHRELSTDTQPAPLAEGGP